MLKRLLALLAALLLLSTALFTSCKNGLKDTYTVTYDGNGATGGTVPVDSAAYAEGDSVTVLGNSGNLEKTSFGFISWNTKADGTGNSYNEGDVITMGITDITLYATWTKDVILTMTSSVDSGYTASDSFTVSFTFNKVVTGFEANDITVTNGSLSGFAGSDDSYSATITAASEGAVIVTAAAGAAADSYGYASTATACTVHYDLTAPESILPTISAIGAGQVTISWNEPADDESFDHVILLYNNNAPVTLENGITEYTFDGLTTGHSYCPIIKAVDAAGNESSYREGSSVTLYDDTLRNVYFVTTASELAVMSEDLSGYYLIESNISLSTWTPVGSSASPFTGIVEGQGRTISGMTVSAGSYRGFLGYGSSAYLRNFSLDNASLSIASGNSYCGLIAGRLVNSKVETVDVSGTISASSNYGDYVGGLAGSISGTTIESCSVNGVIKGHDYCGGLVGLCEGTSSIELCSVTSESSPGMNVKAYSAGLVGCVKNGSLTMDQCYTRIDIASQSGDNASALCARIESSGSLTITNCYTRGYVQNGAAGSCTGGLFGYSGGTINCSNTYSQGVVTGGYTHTGGLYGYIGSGLTVSEVYYSSNTGQTSPGDGVAKGTLIDDDSLKSLVTTAGWDTSIWDTDSTVNDGYPYLLNNPFN